MNAIKELTINDLTVKAKGSYAFGQMAKQYAEEDENGKKTDGIMGIFTGLLQQDPDALIKFWHCATSHIKNPQIKFEDIAKAIEDVAETGDLQPYFVGALEVLNKDGYYKGKLKTYWFMMFRAAKMKTGEEKDKAMEQIEMFKAMFKEITGEEPYEMTKESTSTTS